jgi:hypothetical protein
MFMAIETANVKQIIWPAFTLFPNSRKFFPKDSYSVFAADSAKITSKREIGCKASKTGCFQRFISKSNMCGRITQEEVKNIAKEFTAKIYYL